MQGPQNLFFTPNPSTPYKIVSVMDQKKAFTVQDHTQKIIVNEYNGAHNQLFKILHNNHKYAFVNPISDSAIRVDSENKNQGASLKVDPNNFQSSFIQIVPVSKGEWAGRSCHLMTFANGLAVDIKGGKATPGSEVCPSKFSGNNNQQWMIVPADNIQKLPPPPPQTQASNQNPNPTNLNTNINTAVTQVATNQPQVKPSPQQVNPVSKQQAKPVQGPQPMNPIPKQEIKPQQINLPEVPKVFAAKAGTAYKINSLLQQSKVLTVSNDKKLHINTYKGEISQKFNVYVDKAGKVALVACSNNSGLCILKDDKNNGAQVVTDSDKKGSSWFTVVRADKGKYANKGYLIKTFVGTKAIQITGGKVEEGKNIVQSDIHQEHYQLWNFQIFQDPKLNKKDSKKDQKKNTSQKQSPTTTSKGKRANQPIKPQPVPNTPKPTTTTPTPATNTPASQVNKTPTPTPAQTPTPGKGKFTWGGQLEKSLSLVPQSTPGGNQGMGFIQFAQFKPNQPYVLYPINGNMKNALEVAADKHLIMNVFNGQINQRFIFELEGNMYRIKNVKENKYLNLATDDQKDGILVKCDEKGTAKSQFWAILPTSDAKYAGKGAFHIRTIFGKTLQAPGNKLDNNLKIQQGPFTGSEGQTWIIKEI